MERKATIFDLARMLRATKVCESCPVYAVCNESKAMCEADYIYDDLNEEVLKWCDEHPEKKTYKQDFLEKFPNVPRFNSGEIAICRRKIYGTPLYCPKLTCEGCWNEEMGNERI